MQHAEFVHLHVHSEYSLLDGAAQLEKLVQKARALKFPAIALTDHDQGVPAQLSLLAENG